MPKSTQTALRAAQSPFLAKKERRTAAPMHFSHPISRPGPCNNPPRPCVVNTVVDTVIDTVIDTAVDPFESSFKTVKTLLSAQGRKACWEPPCVDARISRKSLLSPTSASPHHMRLRQLCVSTIRQAISASAGISSPPDRSRAASGMRPFLPLRSVQCAIRDATQCSTLLQNALPTREKTGLEQAGQC